MGRRLTPVAARFALAHPVEIRATWPLNCPKATKRLSKHPVPPDFTQNEPSAVQPGGGATTSYRFPASTFPAKSCPPCSLGP